MTLKTQIKIGKTEISFRKDGGGKLQISISEEGKHISVFLDRNESEMLSETIYTHARQLELKFD